MEVDPGIFFQMLSDSTRLRVLMLLQREGELCVCELTHALALSQPKISRHLAQLRESGVVETRRAGKWMFYRLSDSLPEWAQATLKSTLKGLHHARPYLQDREWLNEMPGRPEAGICA